MATANDELRDIQLRRAIHLEQFKARQARDLVKALKDADPALQERLIRNLSSFEHTRGSERRKRLDHFLMVILPQLRRETFEELQGILLAEVTQLMQHELAFQLASLQKAVPVDIAWKLPPEPPSLGGLDILGLTAQEHLERLAGADLDRTQRHIRRLVSQRATTGEIISTLPSGTVQHQLSSVANTITSAGVNEAKWALFNANSDILEAYQWLATLDGRTTAICRSLDGEIFKLGEGPWPPLHHNERSVPRPLVSAEAASLAGRPFVRDARTRKLREHDFRVEARESVGAPAWKNLSRQERNALVRTERRTWAEANIGTTTKDLDYGEWLRIQPPNFQDSALGQAKGKLFRKGKLDVDQFVRREDGHEWTLEELRRREPEAWQAAGL